MSFGFFFEQSIQRVSCVDPTSRIFLIALENGIEILCMETGRSLQSIEIKNFNCHNLAFDRVGHFYCTTSLGTLRFPYRLPGESMSMEIDFPERIHLPAGNLHISTSDDGNTIAAGVWNGFDTLYYSGCWIKRVDEPAAIRATMNLHGSACSVSPDGRFVGALIQNPSHLDDFDCNVFRIDPKIECIHRFPTSTRPVFSADGKWLLANHQRISTDSWISSVDLGDATPIGMTSDGRFALSLFGQTLSLINAESGKTLANLESPVALGTATMAPNGMRIVDSAADAFHVYDLALIRSQLKDYGLDWDAPDYLVSSSSPVKQISIVPELKEIANTNDLFDEVGTSRFAAR